MPQRRLVDPALHRGSYPLLGSLVAPRPIAWVSTTSPDGVDNLAPHSFSTIVSSDPAMVLVSSIGEKDTARNARATGELVICGAPFALRHEVNLTGVEFAHDVSEFDEVGLTREPSERVRPPRVAQSPFALECRLADVVTVGNGILLIAEVLLIAVDESVLAADGASAHAALLGLAARHGAAEWSAVGEVVDLPRVSLERYLAQRGAGQGGGA